MQYQKGVLGKDPSSFRKAPRLVGPATGAGFDIMLGVSSLFQLVMVSPTSEQYDSLLRQMSERIDEGCGETIYVIGQGSGECSQLRETTEKQENYIRTVWFI